MILTGVLVLKARRVDKHGATTTAWQLTPVIAPHLAGAQIGLRW